jgi:hypothetical protein
MGNETRKIVPALAYSGDGEAKQGHANQNDRMICPQTLVASRVPVESWPLGNYLRLGRTSNPLAGSLQINSPVARTMVSRFFLTLWPALRAG